MQSVTKNIVISIDNASKSFTNLSRPALDSVTLKFNTDKISAIVGPNGAGKTTLVKAISNLINLDGGKITFSSNSGENKRPSIALVLDGGKGFYGRLTVVENFRYFVSLANEDCRIPTHAECEQWLSRFNLAEKAKSQCQTLSRGMLQRLGIAVAVASAADVILLDEPTNGLDIAESNAFFQLIREIQSNSRALVIFSSHQPDAILGLADEVIFLKSGKVLGMIDKTGLLKLSQEEFVAEYLAITKT